jgi:hypothetical protein
VLYTFVTDTFLYTGVVFDAVGRLYGTTQYGPSKYGTVFRLTPHADGSWTKRDIHVFEDHPADNPWSGVIFDPAGNLYGTTPYSSGGFGVVFKLTPKSGGGWTYTVLHQFEGKPSAESYGGLVLDKAGNAYGTNTSCGSGYKCKGTVFELTP